MEWRDEGKVPTTRFDGSLFPPRERFAAWGELARGYDKIIPEGSTLDEFEVDCRAWLLDDLVVTANHVVLPRPVLDAAVPDAPRLHGRLLEGASGRLFAEHMLSLERHLPGFDQRDAPLVRNTTVALLANAVGALPKQVGRVSRTARAASIGKVRTYIDENLTNRELSVERICRDVAVTRPTLYRAFQTSKGVAGYIQRRRLEAAHARLSDHANDMTMASIAELFCFSSAAHFSTAFKRQFGYTPREARGSALQSSDASALFDGWRDTLDVPAVDGGGSDG